ncbi:MAG: type I methionyl aminopeptidase [Candidatus Buchananbacteria bacterium]|nr:type I methionyl aminopeptidase [Candidatus Buchananbacteria bacterium]
MKQGYIKTAEEIAIIRQGGKILAEVLKQLLSAAQAGVKTIELDLLAEKLIRQSGGLPAFKNYADSPSETPFPTTICASVNDQVVHTPAGDYALKSGDILSIDIGMKYPATDDGLYTDMAKTKAIGSVPQLTRKLLKVTAKSLELGIAQVKPGNTIGDISRAIQKYVEDNGFSIVRQLVGHGVGYAVHEDPRVPNFYDPVTANFKLEEGMVIAIEPMVNIGDYRIEVLDDDWTIVTSDGSLSAHFEHTVAVVKGGHKVLTAL